MIVFLLEAAVGGLSYLYETQVETELKTTLNTTFIENYGIDERKTIAIDNMQQEVSITYYYSYKEKTNFILNNFLSINVVAQFDLRTGSIVFG